MVVLYSHGYYLFFLTSGVEFICMTIDIFDEFIQNDHGKIFRILNEACFVVSFTMINMILYLHQKKRRKHFLKDTQALISIHKGVLYHLREYYVTELIITLSFVFLSLILYIYNPFWSPMGIVYRFFGLSWGLIISICLIFTVQIGSIVFSQYRWRLEFLL